MTENKVFMGIGAGRSIERKEGKYGSILVRTNHGLLHVGRVPVQSIYHQAAGCSL